MTLEEAIANAEAQAIRNEKEAKRKREYGGEFYDSEIQACLICAEQYRQLAEWLSELKERRKQIDVIHCGECRFNVSSHKCLHPESFFLVPPDDFYCGYAERRSDGHGNNG